MDFEELIKREYKIINVEQNNPLISYLRIDDGKRVGNIGIICEKIGIIYPTGDLYIKIKARHELPNTLSRIYLIITDEKRFMLAKIKYGF
jgi:hypothetical protein